MEYIFGLDPSLSNFGICIFDINGNPIEAISVATSQKDGEHGKRLKIIADVLLDLRKKYETHLIALESGFSRHMVSTQVLYRVRGLCDYIFYDCEVRAFAPSSVKKIVGGSGKTSKTQLQEIISKKFPTLKFDDEDQSDACCIGTCLLIEKNLMKL